MSGLAIATENIAAKFAKPLAEYASGGSVTFLQQGSAGLNWFNKMRQTVVVKGLRVFETIFGHDKNIGTPLEQAVKGANPVLLIGGFANTNKSWAAYAHGLGRDGFKTFVMTVPGNAMSDLQTGAKLVAQEIDKILMLTGAKQVDMVGYSAGGLIARSAAHDFATVGSVGKVITLNTPNHGELWDSMFSRMVRKFVRVGGGVSASQMLAGSEFLNRLNDRSIPDAAGPGIQYFSVYSKVADLVVNPPHSAMLDFGTNVPIGKLGGERNVLKLAMGPDHYTILQRSAEAYDAVRAALMVT